MIQMKLSACEKSIFDRAADGVTGRHLYLRGHKGKRLGTTTSQMMQYLSFLTNNTLGEGSFFCTKPGPQTFFPVCYRRNWLVCKDPPDLNPWTGMTSLMLLWLNGKKSLQPGSKKIWWRAWNQKSGDCWRSGLMPIPMIILSIYFWLCSICLEHLTRDYRRKLEGRLLG